ncbi:hypothetical protein [Limimaricola hongkongensis]|uniref:Lipoprotein n=1 Tax=Limimaricola hongkongensis DSM 17492 TaxID=1122180 RepID=A0A017HF77_9RHOB|nr:hypothetical protein [Limimaricola hongkongensis]EYD73001.1 hypothetical protein Lokhon_00526 [Limimaricola hongkongensis DSM 17492]
MRYVMTGGALAALLLAGCAEVGPVAGPIAASFAAPPVLPPSAPVRALPEPEPFAAEFAEPPFSEGIVSVITEDGQGRMATYRLVPCQQGRAICVGGRAGQLSRAGDTYVVSGVGGKSFHLQTGGDGFVTYGGKTARGQVPLAWEHFPEIGI